MIEKEIKMRIKRKMNKRGVVEKALALLPSIIIIAILFISFYSYYKIRGGALDQKIIGETEKLSQTSALVTLLRTPDSVTGKTIAEFIADKIKADSENNKAEADNFKAYAKKLVKETIEVTRGTKCKYSLKVEDEIFAQSTEEPSSAISQQAVIPSKEGLLIKVTLEIETS